MYRLPINRGVFKKLYQRKTYYCNWRGESDARVRRRWRGVFFILFCWSVALTGFLLGINYHNIAAITFTCSFYFCIYSVIGVSPNIFVGGNRVKIEKRIYKRNLFNIIEFRIYNMFLGDKFYG